MLAASAGALLFGLLSHAVNAPTADRAFANVAAEGILGLVVPIAALVIGDAVLGAEVRSGTFLFTWMSPAPTWQIVLGRWLGGALVGLVTIAPACRARRGRRRCTRHRRAGLRRRGGRVGLLRRAVHRRRLPHPPHRGLVAGDRVPRRAAARCGADGHRPALADVGVAGRVRRPARRPAVPARARGHPRRAATAIVRLAIVTVGGARRGDVADAPHAPVRRRRLSTTAAAARYQFIAASSAVT